MLPNKISGAEITITCRGFKNPISEGEWRGFQLTLFDDEGVSNTIEFSSSNIAFDSRGF